MDVSARQRRMHVTKFASPAEHDRADAAYRRHLSVAERVRQVWRLSEQPWRRRGEFRDASGLVFTPTSAAPRCPSSGATHSSPTSVPPVD